MLSNAIVPNGVNNNNADSRLKVANLTQGMSRYLGFEICPVAYPPTRLFLTGGAPNPQAVSMNQEICWACVLAKQDDLFLLAIGNTRF